MIAWKPKDIYVILGFGGEVLACKSGMYAWCKGWFKCVYALWPHDGLIDSERTLTAVYLHRHFQCAIEKPQQIDSDS